MKRTLLACTALIIPLFLLAQNPEGGYNPYVNQGTISPSPIYPAQASGTGEIVFNFGNTGSDPLTYYADQYLMLTVTLSYGEPDNVDPVAAVSGTAAGYFSWTYSAGTYTAHQNMTIPANFSGTINIAYRVTQNSASPGSNGFNVNITPAAYQTASNTADDDQVSSYTYTEIRDYGDAPATYGTADHIMNFTRYLGALVDGEDVYQPSVNADADDLNGEDDEDGVTFPSEMEREQTVNIPVAVSGLGYLNVWIDWNGDGDFLDTGEQVTSDKVLNNETWNLLVTIPADAIISAPTFARFRFSTDPLSSPNGTAFGGEVEDYQITFLCAPPEPTLTVSETAFCEGTNVTFTAGGGNNYLFRVDGVTAQDGTSDTYVTDSLSNGSQVDVVVTDGIGCSATSTGIAVNVYSLPTPALTSSDPDNAFCAGTEVIFTASGGVNYNFRVDGTSVQNGPGTTYTTSSLQDGQTLDVVVTNENGCSSVSPEIVHTVYALPNAPVVDVTDQCDGTSTLSTNASGDLHWSTGEITASIIVTNAGTYTVTTTVDGCTSEPGSGTASPNTAPSAPVVSDATPENLCPDLTVDLTALVISSMPGGGTIIYKTVNDPLGTNVTDPLVASAGTYYLYYQDAEGCYSAGTEVTVTINACPADLTPTLQVSPNIMHGVTGFNLVVRITELNGVNTTGTITVNIPKDARWILTDGFVTSLTTIGSTNLNNSDWSYSEDSVNHIFTSNVAIAAGGLSNFGFRVTFDPGSTRGLYTITSQLVSGSGGEARVSNNVDSEKIDYFQE